MKFDVEKARLAKTILREVFVGYTRDDMLGLLDAAIAQHERLADYEADAARVREDRCPSDEHHCACVVHLRREIMALQERQQQAQNKSRCPGNHGEQCCGYPDLCAKALAGTPPPHMRT